MSEEKKYPVITITREYCAYGRTVAAALSQRMGVEYFDRDIVNKTIIESKFSEDADHTPMEHVEQFLQDMLGSIAAYSSSFDKIFAAQKSVILDMAKKPCILVGRCANVILKEAGIPSVDVFLYADRETRMNRCKELNPDLNEDQMDRRIRVVDEDRQIFYKTFGKVNMNDPHNYDICIDVGKLGVDKAVEAILALITE